MAFSKSSMVYVIQKSFKISSNSYFPPQNLGQHGMNEYSYINIYFLWKFLERKKRPPEYNYNDNLKTDMLLDCCSVHYKIFSIVVQI